MSERSKSERNSKKLSWINNVKQNVPQATSTVYSCKVRGGYTGFPVNSRSCYITVSFQKLSGLVMDKYGKNHVYHVILV